MTLNYRVIWPILLFWAGSVYGQAQKKSFEAQSQSTIAYTAQNIDTVDINNVLYEVVGSGIPGRPSGERLVLRKTTHTKQVLDEIGMEATTTVEAWPLGVDLKEKPLYSVTVPGIDPIIMNNGILVISRGLEEVGWWSVYKLGNGEHLFDTYLPVVPFSTSRETQTLRYVGLEVPPDDVVDQRLKAPNVIGVLTYASAERVIREALITADDVKVARALRSYADATRTIAFTSGNIRLSVSQNYPSAPKTVTIAVPIVRDDLDLTGAQTPPGLRVTAWKR